jgi:hypothetical protein
MANTPFYAAQNGIVSSITKSGEKWNVTLVYDDGSTQIFPLLDDVRVMQCMRIKVGDIIGYQFSTVSGINSIGLAMPTQFVVNGSPLTANGNISVSWDAVTDHFFLGAPSGGGLPVFRQISYNELTDLPTIGVAYTNEMAQDTVAAMIQNGTGISWAYNDAANTLTPTVSLSPFSTTNLAEGSNLYFTNERVDDRVAALIQNGTGITWAYDDTLGTLTPTVTVSGGGGGTTPSVRTIPFSTYNNPVNPLLQEADNYITTTYSGSARVGVYQSYASTISAISRKELIPDKSLYSAFPNIVRSPTSGTILIGLMQGNGHAINTTAGYIRSTDDGKTWSEFVALIPRGYTTQIYPGAIGVRASDGKFFYFCQDFNVSGLQSKMFSSTDDGVTFTLETTFDLSSDFAEVAYTQTYNILETPSGAQLLGIYGTDTPGSNFKVGYYRTTDSFATKTYHTFTQTPASDKFNEISFLQKGTSIYAFIRSENLLGPTLYKSVSTDDGLTFSTPVAVTFDILTGRTMPAITLLPDGKMLLTQRRNTATLRGGMFLSDDNGSSFQFKGHIYPSDNPFMYSSQIVYNNTVLMTYAYEPGSIPFSGGRCGVYLATFPAYPNTLFYHDDTHTELLSAQNVYNSITNGLATFEGVGSVIKGNAQKQVTIRTDTLPSNENVALVVGGDIEQGTGLSLINQITHSAIRSSPFYHSNQQGAPSFSNLIGKVTTVAETEDHFGCCKAGGLVYVGGDGATILVYNPYTGEKTSVPSSIFEVNEGMVSVGKYVYSFPTGSTTGRKTNIEDGSQTTVTLPSTGWTGVSYAGRFIWSSKRGGSNEILKYNPVDDTYAILTLPTSLGLATGPFDGTYQWFLGYSDTTWVKINVYTDEIIEVNKLFGGISSLNKIGMFDGVNIWGCGNSTRFVTVYNPNTNLITSIELPTGTTVSCLVFDGMSVWAIPYTGQLYKINPKTFEFVAISIPDGGATNKYGTALLFYNRIVLFPIDAGVITTIETVELGADLFQVIKNQSTYTGANFIVNGNSLQANGNYNIDGRGKAIEFQTETVRAFTFHGTTPTSYANAGGTGDRSASITVTTNMTMGAGTVGRFVNGNLSTNNTWWTIQDNTGKYVQFDFGAGNTKVITEIKFYQSTSDSHGTFVCQGSNNATTWATLGSPFTLGGATTQTIATMSSNATNYRYYRIEGTGGNTYSGPWLYQFEFKIADGTAAGISNIQTYSDIAAGTAGGTLNIQPDGGNMGLGGTINILSAPAVYSSGGYDYLVRNQISGALETRNLSPAGSDTQVQYNNSGAFGASSNFTWASNQLGITGEVIVNDTRTGQAGGINGYYAYTTHNFDSTATNSGAVFASSLQFFQANVNANQTLNSASLFSANMNITRIGSSGSAGSYTANLTQAGGNSKRVMSANAALIQLQTLASGVGVTVDYVAGMQVIAPQATLGTGVSSANLPLITNYYGLLIAPSDEYSNSSANITNRYGVMQLGASDKNVCNGWASIGHLNDPTAALDLSATNGYEQLRLRTSYTPTSSSDANGLVGAFGWDSGHLYLKTGTGWKAVLLATF